MPLKISHCFVLVLLTLFPYASNSFGQGAVVDTIWPDSQDNGQGWRTSPWFGTFNFNSLPWVYHRDLGWLEIGDSSTQTSIFLFDPFLGWLWTNNTSYPDLYSYDRSSWIFFTVGTSAPRLFYDRSLQDGVSLFQHDGISGEVKNGFNLFNSAFPASQILTGGPARDGIPSIDFPKFTSIEEAGFLKDNDVVVSVTFDNATRAYPFLILNWHEVVNDNIGETYFSVSYCPLCATAFVIDRKVNGRLLTFGVSGLLFSDNLLMYDRQTESLWQQFSLQSIAGPQVKSKLRWLFSEQMTFSAWREKYPEGMVLSTDTGFVNINNFSSGYTFNPYSQYEGSPNPPRFSGDIRDDLPAKAIVFGIVIDGVAKAYPRESLASGVTFEDFVNGTAISLSFDEEADSIRAAETDTGSDINGVRSFWFAWQAFHPETEVWMPSA
jgi:hypothetical protein